MEKKIIVTNKCNNKCVFCDLKKKEPTEEEIKNELDIAKENGAKKIVFTGGEPTIRKDIIDFVKYAKELGFLEIWMETNGRMFAYRDFTKKIVEAGLTRVIINFPASEQKIFENITGVKKSFLQTVMGLKNLSKEDIFISISTVITKLNYRDLYNIVLFLHANFVGINQFSFSFLHPCKNYEKLVVNFKELGPHLEKMLKFCKNTNIDVSVEGVPLCFMNGYEHYSFDARRSLFDMRLTEINPFNDKEEMKNLENKKIKLKKCRICSLNELCPGVWKKYNRLFNIQLQPSEKDKEPIKSKMTSYYQRLDKLIKKYRGL